MRLTQRLSARSSAPRLSLWWRRSVMGRWVALNINADLVAQQLAIESPERLLLMTDVDGVKDQNGELIRQFDVADVDALIEDGTISVAAILKVRGAVEALRGGVAKVTIMNGTVPHAILLELFTDEGRYRDLGSERIMTSIDSARAFCANLSAAGPDHRARTGGLAARPRRA